MLTNNDKLRHLAVALAGVMLLAACQSGEPTTFNAVQYVNPQIGSVHGRWFFYTPASLPFGMAKLAPHTNAYGSAGGWGPCGYDDRHASIEGFGHFHEFQIGGLVYMPTTGPVQTVPGSLSAPDSGYRSRFDKADEHAEAGYYSVQLQDYNIKAELTATERVGLQRYTFPATTEANLIIDIGHRQGESGAVTEAYAEWINPLEVAGYIEAYPEYARFCDPDRTLKMYFVARLSKAPTSTGAFVDTTLEQGATQTKGTGNGLYLRFSMQQDEQLLIQTGLSYTSIANARLNLETETRGKDFDQVRVDATKEWNRQLGRIQAEGGDSADRVKFYTGLYHALLGRGISSDVNGQYPQYDGTIGQVPVGKDGQPAYHHYNTDGMWGGFWNLTQLWALAYPERFSAYVQSNIDYYKYRGWLHDGEAAGIYTNGVQTNFQGLLIASAHHCGIRTFDTTAGYEAALKNELEWRGRNLGNGKYDLAYFNKLGYVPYKDTVLSNGWVFNFGASHTLEYAYSSYAVAEWAAAMGKKEDAAALYQQAGYYINLFDTTTRFIRPRLETGPFISKFDPMKAWDGFQEGNAFQFTWYVPHDVAGLMQLMGPRRFQQQLQDMFEDAARYDFGGGTDEVHSFSGIERKYNHGNQPSLHNAWLFNYAGMPWLTQKYTRAICHQFYGTEPLRGYGVGQDEDQGQLGAWYVMAAMGLFDVQGHAAAQPTFQVGSPLFDKVTIQLHPDYYKGKTLVIEAENQQPENAYVQALSWNSQPLQACWIDRKLLMQGGTLRFTMGPAPQTQWGIAPPPPSMSPIIEP